jgi:uncharacterized protein YqjF (DUF2071 family)
MTLHASQGHVVRPSGRPAMRMTWLHLLFAHWPVPIESLRPLVPGALDIDAFDGRAWVGLIPFTMRGVGHTIWPWIPTMRRFHECNVRTYVSVKGIPGVYFFSLDAANRIAVWGARRFWHLNYQYSRMNLERDGDVMSYSVDRVGNPAARLRCAWRVGPRIPRSRPGELAHFLTERYCLYAIDRAGRPLRARIWHEPWPLRQAALLELDDGLVGSAGIEVTGEPVSLLAADEMRVEAWGLEAI